MYVACKGLSDLGNGPNKPTATIFDEYSASYATSQNETSLSREPAQSLCLSASNSIIFANKFALSLYPMINILTKIPKAHAPKGHVGSLHF